MMSSHPTENGSHPKSDTKGLIVGDQVIKNYRKSQKFKKKPLWTMIMYYIHLYACFYLCFSLLFLFFL